MPIRLASPRAVAMHFAEVVDRAERDKLARNDRTGFTYAEIMAMHRKACALAAAELEQEIAA